MFSRLLWSCDDRLSCVSSCYYLSHNHCVLCFRVGLSLFLCCTVYLSSCPSISSVQCISQFVSLLHIASLTLSLQLCSVCISSWPVLVSRSVYQSSCLSAAMYVSPCISAAQCASYFVLVCVLYSVSVTMS